MTGKAEPRITCIVPTLNRGHVLCNTIQMLLNQSHRPDEIVIVDQTVAHDAHIQRTLDDRTRDSTIILIRDSEPNASRARNVSAELATGDVLLFLDDDIQMGRDFVAAHARNYLDRNVAAMSGQVLEIEKEVTTRLRAPPDDAEIGWIRFTKNYGKRCITSWMAADNVSVRRSVCFAVGGMDENYKRGAFREETDFAMRLLQAGYRFQFDPAASIVHLGCRAVPRGGARSWKNPFEMHHYVGDWYFNLRYLRWRNALQLIWYSIRHLIVSRRKVERPWL